MFCLCHKYALISARQEKQSCYIRKNSTEVNFKHGPVIDRGNALEWKNSNCPCKSCSACKAPECQGKNAFREKDWNLLWLAPSLVAIFFSWGSELYRQVSPCIAEVMSTFKQWELIPQLKKESPYKCWEHKGTEANSQLMIFQVKKIFKTVTNPSADLATLKRNNV